MKNSRMNSTIREFQCIPYTVFPRLTRARAIFFKLPFDSEYSRAQVKRGRELNEGAPYFFGSPISLDQPEHAWY